MTRLNHLDASLFDGMVALEAGERNQHHPTREIACFAQRALTPEAPRNEA